MVQSIVNLPTYEQVTDVATNVELTKIKIGEVKLDTSNIIAIVNDGLGTDWSKYKPFFRAPSAVFSPNPETYKVTYEVTGEGYLSLAAIRGHSIGLGVHMKISIDGVTVLELSCNVDTNNFGFFSPEVVITNSTGAISFADSNMSTVRFTGPRAQYLPQQQANRSFLSTQPLFFNSSMKIELKAGSANDPGNFPLHVAGGVIL